MELQRARGVGGVRKEVEGWRSGRFVEYELVAEFRSGGYEEVQMKCKDRGQEVEKQSLWSKYFSKVLAQI